MGSAFHVPVVRTRALGARIEDGRRKKLRIIATVPRGGTPMYHVDFTQPSAVLLGGEGSGLPDEFVSAADDRVSIPMHGRIESLNAAVAAALLLYEAQRQRSVRL